MIVDEKYISEIVANVVGSMQKKESEPKQKGVFDTMSEALEAVAKAYEEFKGYTVAQREKMISKIRELILEEADVMAQLGVEETGMGRVADKVIKHQLVANKTPGTDPHACKTANYAVDLVNRAIQEAGGPENLVVSVKKPTRESSNEMMASPIVRMLVATGGPGVVKALLSSGKKAIGAGAGNPPVIVDDTADVEKAGADIVAGASFDNNLPCIAEKECFVFQNVADELIASMQKNGAYLISGTDIDKLVKLCLIEKNGKYSINKDWVGRDAKKFLKAIGIDADPRLIICEVDNDHPFVQVEMMMPVLGIVRVKDIDEAIKLAVAAEHGNRHSAHIHSKNIDNLSRFARAVETTIFVKNAPSYAGIGAGGEGYTTFTIAGPTGEGLTAAHSFTRQRRCVMVDNLHIV